MDSINHINKSNIKYISLGSFCHPKMHLRKTKREISKSLPFDFHSSPNTYSIYSILDKLYENETFNHKFKEIIFEHTHNSENKKELAVSDYEDIYFLHFFDNHDLIIDLNNLNLFENITENTNNDINNIIQEKKIKYPLCVDNHLSLNKINEVNEKFKKRYENLYSILNNKFNKYDLDILVLLRIENYKNPNWKIDIQNLVNSIKQYEHPNKFLIYIQIDIDEQLDFFHTCKINYDYDFPIIFHKLLFDEKISFDVNQEKMFENILVNFENIINCCIYLYIHNTFQVFYNDSNKILVNLNNICELYRIQLINHQKLELIHNNEILVFLKNKNNVYECIS
jgi:hypothetical protein